MLQPTSGPKLPPLGTVANRIQNATFHQGGRFNFCSKTVLAHIGTEAQDCHLGGGKLPPRWRQASTSVESQCLQGSTAVEGFLHLGGRFSPPWWKVFSTLVEGFRLANKLLPVRLVFMKAHLSDEGSWSWAGFRKQLEHEGVRREVRGEMAQA